MYCWFVCFVILNRMKEFQIIYSVVKSTISSHKKSKPEKSSGILGPT